MEALLEAPREPTAEIDPRRPALAPRAVAPAVRPPIFQGASRDRDDVMAALDRMELPRERFPSEVVDGRVEDLRVGELRRAEELLRPNKL